MMKILNYKSLVVAAILIGVVSTGYSFTVKAPVLDRYKLAVNAHVIEGIEENLSGITFNDDTKRLWVIVNKPAQILELDKNLNISRVIKLKNFEDTEALAYAGNGRFLIADERRQSIVLVNVGDETKSLDKLQSKSFTLDTGGGNNKGWEGLAINRQDNSIYVARERDPMRIIKIEGFLRDGGNLALENFSESVVDELPMSDFSGMHFDQSSDRILVLSDESKLLAELDIDGNVLGYLQLQSNEHSVQTAMPQPEGVATDDSGHLYIVSEPNLVYRFDRS